MAPSPEMIEATRQAAALWIHWNRDDRDGIRAVLDEVGGHDPATPSDLRWENFTLAVLYLGTQMVKAARNGRDAEHLSYVLRSSSVDEATGEYRS